MQKTDNRLTKIHIKPGQFQFKHFPGFAEYLLKNRLKEYMEEYLHLMFSLNLPALKQYDIKTYSEDQLTQLSMASGTIFLNYIIQNKLEEHVNESIQKWISNQLPVITRDQVIVEDITLTIFLRKKSFLKFIPEYFPRTEDAIKLINEIDNYCLEVESTSFHAFMSIQQEKINEINRELQKHEEQLLEAQKIAELGSFEWDLTGQHKSEFTPQLYKIFEMNESSNLTEFLEYVYPTDRKKLLAAIDKAVKGETDYDCEYRYKRNGKEKVIWSRGIVNFVNGKPVVMKGTVMDVTNRRHILNKLERSEELHKQAQALTHIGNWSWDVLENKITWSDELYRIYGLEPQSEEITFERFLSFIHPEEREMRQLQMQQSLTSLQPEDHMIRIILPDGSTKIIRAKGNLLIDENNKPYKWVGTCQDVTKEVLLTQELEALNASLEQKNKELERSNKELTSFSYVASHDLQEPLRKIKTFINLIIEKDYNLLSQNGKEYFERIKLSASRMQKLIDDLLTFSRMHTYANTPELVDINIVLKEIKNLHKEYIEEKNIIIESNTLPVINAIPFQMQQLFENIISNSIKYSKPDLPLYVKITSEQISGKYISFKGSDKNKNYYKISISDNGIGFEQKHAEKVFEIFQRLHGKSEYPGTGIGLSICKKIMENHNGFITSKGTLNEGATFEVYFPY